MTDTLHPNGMESPGNVLARQERVRDAITNLLEALGVEIDDHTVNTPTRAARMWEELLEGTTEDPRAHLHSTFSAPEDGGLIIQSGIDFTSVCAHHLLPFSGYATVAYRPNPGQEVVGLSKLTRLLRGYAARLQIQERIGWQVVHGLHEVLKPAGALCMVTAVHGCMRLRGVRDSSSSTTTEAKWGHWMPDEVALIHATHLRTSDPHRV